MKKKLLICIMTLVMVFTLAPISVDAASKPAKPARVASMTAKIVKSNSAKVSWKALSDKQLKKAKVKGYKVYRKVGNDGYVLVKTVKKDTTSFTDKTLKANKKYSYQVRAYSKPKMKVWYNKKTKRWDINKPAKKYRGRHKKMKVETLGKARTSNTIRTPQKKATTSQDGDNGSNTPAGENKPKVENTNKNVVNYLGTKYEMRWDGDGWSAKKEGSSSWVVVNDEARFDRTVDGEFTVSGTTYIQKNEVTIKKSKIVNENSNLPYIDVVMYNGEASKLEIVPLNDTQTVHTFDYDKKPLDRTFVMQGDKRLIQMPTKGDDTISGIKLTRHFGFRQGVAYTGTGFTTGQVNLSIRYAGQEFFTASFIANSGANAEGLNSWRAAALEKALAAIEANGGPKSYTEDMEAIEDYIYTHYSKAGMACGDGADVLETYSIYAYGIYGFKSYGSEGPDVSDSNYGTHIAFHLDSDPTTYFETQGH